MSHLKMQAALAMAMAANPGLGSLGGTPGSLREDPLAHIFEAAGSEPIGGRFKTGASSDVKKKRKAKKKARKANRKK